MTPCPVCRNATGNTTLPVREMMMGTREVFEYGICARCESAWLLHPPANLGKYYEQAYYSLKQVEEVFASRSKNIVKYIVFSLARLHPFLARQIFNIFPDDGLAAAFRAAPKKNERILDVGCGSGQLLYLIRLLGFRNVLGIDPFIVESVVYPNGLEIRKQSLAELSGTFDVIMFHHSLEHVSDPRAELKQTYARLSEGGRCVVRIPTRSSYAARHYGADWVGYDAPRHFTLFSRKGIEALAEEAGFTVKEIVDDSTAGQFWMSEQYAKDISLTDERSYDKNPARSIFSLADIARFAADAKTRNAHHEGDAIACILVKSPRKSQS